MGKLARICGILLANTFSWHADIKPDNILRVLGEFKLADFGFSRFTPKNGKTSTPTEYIVGGTNTYGKNRHL
jgi:serine/threonine protein kinase